VVLGLSAAGLQTSAYADSPPDETAAASPSVETASETPSASTDEQQDSDIIPAAELAKADVVEDTGEIYTAPAPETVVGADGYELNARPDTVNDDALQPTTTSAKQTRVKASSLPSSYDVRSAHPGWVTAVRDQGEYGACWSFASTASAESSAYKNGAGGQQLSPAHLVYSVYDTNTFKPCSSGSGCTGNSWERMLNSGGNLYMAGAAWSNWRGSEAETALPYPATNGYASVDPNMLDKSRYHLRNLYVVPSPWVYSGSGWKYSSTNLDAIKQALYTYGSLYTSYHAAINQAENTAYLNTSTSAYYDYGNNQNSPDHAVTLVGWNDNYPASKFKKTPPGNGAFIVKNSWGSNWGDDGYFYLSYYDTSIQEAAYFDMGGGTVGAGSDGLEHLFSVDELGWQTSWSLSNTTGRVANVFTVPSQWSTQSLDAVQFVTAQPNVNYTIQVYSGLTGSSPTSGTLRAISSSGGTSVSGNAGLAGYHTVNIAPTPLQAGTTFSVVVTLSIGSGNVQMALEAGSPSYDEQVTLNPGESYFGTGASGGWTDLYSYIKATGLSSYYGNLNIKAMTSTPELKSISIKGMQTTYFKGTKFNFKAGTVTLKYSNGGGETISFSDKLLHFYGINTGTFSKKTGTKKVKVEYSNLTKTYKIKVVTKGTLKLNVNKGKKLKKTKYSFKYKQKIKLPKPTRKGYKFLGWYTAKSGGTKVTSTKKLTGPMTLYAHWKKK
jgi:uncharacterized repeat protein (TIGR02543 family)